jgi:hypothetical protein
MAELVGRTDLLLHEDYWPPDRPLPEETLWPEKEVRP